jgi:photosystem II stability/assembly factor-like uncharacterized protein
MGATNGLGRLVALVGVGLLACNTAPREGAGPATRRLSALGVSPGSWTERGPEPITNFPLATTPNESEGAVQTFVTHPTDPNTLVIGSVNGGIWTTNNAMDPAPTWTPRTEFAPSLSIYAMERDPSNVRTIAASTGGNSSFGFVGGPGGIVLLSQDGGLTWNPLTVPTGFTLTGVTVRGSTILTTSVAGEVFVSTNLGASWANVVGTSGFPGSPGNIWHLTSDPSNANSYYLVGNGGLFRTANAGTTWSNVSQNDPGTGGLAAAAAQSDNAEMAVGADGRLYVAVSVIGQIAYVGFTTNQGASWTRMDPPRFPSANPVAPNTIATASNASPIVITTTVADDGLPINDSFQVGRRLTRVRISGVTGNTAANGDWLAGPVPPSTPGGLSPTNQFQLFDPITGAPSTGNGNGTGGTWQRWFTTNPGGQGGVHLSIAVDPSNSSIVYIGGDAGLDLFQSATTLLRGNAGVAPNNGVPSSQWVNLAGVENPPGIPGGGTANNTSPHADSRKMRIDAAGDMVETCDGGIYRRKTPQNNTGDWTAINTTLGTTELHDVAFDNVPGIMFGGLQDNGTPMQDSLLDLGWPLEEDSDGGDVQAIGIGGGQSIRYTSGQGLGGFILWTFNGNVQVSKVQPTLNVAGSSPVQTLYDVDKSLPFVTHFAIDSQDSTRLVIGGSAAVWESSDRGNTIQSIGNVGSADFAYGHPSNADALWAVNGAVSARFTAGGTLADMGYPGPNDAIDVTMAPADPTQAYVVGFGNGVPGSVWVTSAGTAGRTWTNVTGDLNQLGPRTLRTIVYVPSSSGDRLIVGADGGVFVTSAATPGFWSKVGTNLPHALVFDMDYDATRDLLGVGTMGRGAWTLPNASQLNQAPIARCRNVTVSADGMCLGNVPISAIDNGSSDPDGDPVTLTVAPASPYAKGSTLVTLTVQDNQGASSQCTATVTVNDTTPPVFGPIANNTTTVLCDPNSEALHVTVPTATDNCAHPPTVTGQIIASSDPSLQLPIPINVSNGTVTLSAGTFTIQWTASDGVNTTIATETVTIRAGIYATRAVSVLDRSIVRLPSGGFATILNSGAGTTAIANDSHTGDIVSRGPVTIGDRAIITGSVRSSSTITRNANGGSVVTGGIFPNQTLNFPPALVVTPAFPVRNNGNVTLNPGQTSPIAPAAYNQVTIFSRATANLRAGNYFFNSFDLEPQAVLSLNQGAGPIEIQIRNSMIWRGTDPLAGGTFDGFTLAYFGTQATIMEQSFTGILVAPNTTLTLGSADGGETFTGQFYAQTLTVRPDVNVVCREDF